MDTPTVAAITIGFGALGAAFALYRYSGSTTSAGTAADVERSEDATKQAEQAEQEERNTDIAEEAKKEVGQEVTAWGQFWRKEYDRGAVNDTTEARHEPEAAEKAGVPGS